MAQDFARDDIDDLDDRPRFGRLRNAWRDDFEAETRARLNPRVVGSIMRSAETGSTAALADLLSQIEEDAHVGSVLDKRRRVVSSRRLVIEPSSDTPKAQQAADLCNELVFGVEGEGGIDNLNDALFDATDAIGRAYSVQQIYWDRIDGRFVPVTIEHWPQRDTVIGDPYRAGRGVWRRGAEVRILTSDEPIRGEEPLAGQWIINVNRARSAGLHKAALLRRCVWPWLFKHFSMKDWLIWSEVYGMPRRVGKYPPAADKAERQAVLDAVVNLGKDTAAVVPIGTVIEFIEAKQSGQLPYEPLAKFCNAEISKTILGNTLTTEQGDRGARSLGTVHKSEQEMFADDDALRVAQDYRHYLLRPCVRFNLGERYPIPTAKLIPAAPVGTLDDARRDQILAEMGLPIGIAEMYRKYALSPPDEDEEILNPMNGLHQLARDLSSND